MMTHGLRGTHLWEPGRGLEASKGTNVRTERRVVRLAQNDRALSATRAERALGPDSELHRKLPNHEVRQL